MVCVGPMFTPRCSTVKHGYTLLNRRFKTISLLWFLIQMTSCFNCTGNNCGPRISGVSNSSGNSGMSYACTSANSVCYVCIIILYAFTGTYKAYFMFEEIKFILNNIFISKNLISNSIVDGFCFWNDFMIASNCIIY